MAKKSTNTEETKQSTVVLNDEVNPIQDTTIQNVAENTPTPTNVGDCSNPAHKCTCKPGHCPNKDCKSGHYWTEGTEKDQYLYHYDSDDETIKLEDADHRTANLNYNVPGSSNQGQSNPGSSNQGQSNPGQSNPGDGTEDPDQIPSNDCGPEVEEPWAHDELLQDADGHTGLERELRLHCGVTYDVVKMWLDEIATATDKDAVIDKIAWHIPTGGPKSIKVHHKAKIVEALKALK